MRYQPYIKSLHYNFSALADNTGLSKLTLELSEPGLMLQSAVLSYPDATGEMLTFPLNDELTFLAMNLPTQSLHATAVLRFSNGSSMTQDLGLMFVPFLAGFNIRFEQTAPSVSALNAILSWNILESEINNTQGFELSSAADSCFVETHQSEIVLSHCQPLTPFNLSMQPDKMTGSAIVAQLWVITPKLVLIPDVSHAAGLGYGKQANATTLQEIYQLQRDHTLAEMQAPWQMHQAETASLGDSSSLIQPKTAISHTVKEYVQQHDLTQHSQAFDYADAKTAGIAAGPNTATIWSQAHQGDKTILHAGNISQNRTVQTDQQSLKTPSISNIYQDYAGTYSGATFEQTAQNYSEQTSSEQTTLNQHLVLAPQITESVNQFNQSSQSISISADQYIQAGNQVHYPQSVSAQGQSVSFGGSGAKSPAAFNQKIIGAEPVSAQSYDWIIFVSTVYGEAAGASPAAWKAVASTIINRINNPNFASDSTGQWVQFHSASEAIVQGSYDAETRRSPLFIAAQTYIMKGQKKPEPPKLEDLMNAIRPIYFNHQQVTTDATTYYSPKMHHQDGKVTDIDYTVPSSGFQDEINSGVLRPIKVPGLILYNQITKSVVFDNFVFYKRDARRRG